MKTPHLRVLVGLLIVVGALVVYVASQKKFQGEEIGDVPGNDVRKLLDTLQYNEAIYDSMRSFFSLDSILFKRPNPDKDELIKIGKLLRTPYDERYSVAQEPEIKVLIMMYQFLTATRDGEKRMGELRRTLAVDDTANLGLQLELTEEELSEENEN